MGIKSEAAESAKTYTIVGLIFYVLGVIGNLIPLLFFGFFSDWLERPPFNADIPFSIGPFFLLFFGIPLAFNVGFAVWSWITLANIGKEKFFEARTAAIILGIFGIFLAWIIGGLFFLLAYGKLGEAISGTSAKLETPLSKHRICIHCGKPVGWDVKFCEHCGKDLSKKED
jgi:hypothetical protein